MMEYSGYINQNIPTDQSSYTGLGRPQLGHNISLGTPQAEESASRIRDGITRAEEILSRLHDVIGVLDKRLDTVLSPVPPQPAGNTAAGASLNPPISHLLGRIQILNDGFEHAAQRVRVLTQRVEV